MKKILKWISVELFLCVICIQTVNTKNISQPFLRNYMELCLAEEDNSEQSRNGDRGKL